MNYIHHNYSNFGVLFAHRIHEIRNSSELKQWYYVPSQTMQQDVQMSKTHKIIADDSTDPNFYTK